MNKQLEVGKTYTSENGVEWFCIAANGDVAHMRCTHRPRSVAHTWKLDGTPISLPDQFRIVFEPERGEVALYGRRNSFGYVPSCSDTHRLTLSTLDGELATGLYCGPDGHRIKVEKL